MQFRVKSMLLRKFISVYYKKYLVYTWMLKPLNLYNVPEQRKQPIRKDGNK